ncbi:MAG TPA: pantoate--beta-alanine ligase [Candidatus Limnocylindria bacterium]|jgi:pantoate--beta-alanine ligase|nr:pantoate--beta-alanine ligase [Candidatus Limnocylindria bacterium]
MLTVRTPGDLREALRKSERPIGLVPTMGALHAGHLTLVRRARAESATVVVSLFVNPLQFGPNEDYARYPRAFESDLAALAAAGVDAVYAPDVATMYPPGFATSVDPGPVAERYEGALRPGHFRGVATVCVKLFATVGAERAYFGAKDAQQVAVLQRVVADLDLPVELVVCPTVREFDGLALSSRNVYLSAEERAAAPALHRALDAIVQAVRAGERDRERAVAVGRAELLAATREAYLDVVDPRTFVPPARLEPPVLAIGSVWAGTTRLIDNEPIGTSVPEEPKT